MNVVLGIGNHGSKYDQTAHNMGFILLDFLSQGIWKKQNQYQYQKVSFLEKNFLLVKPQTFVNLTGQAVQSVMSRYHLSLSTIVVLVDDVNLPFGKVRIRPHGSAGGHNGLRNIISTCGQNFPRIRVGIGKCPPRWDLSNWVLRKFSKEELSYLQEIGNEIDEIITTGFIQGWEIASQRYNF